MGFSLKKFLEGAAAQLNTRDGGKTFSTVMNQPKQAPAQTPAPQGMNFAGSKTYGTFNRPSPVVNLAQKQIAQTPKVNTKNRYSQVNAPSYGSGLSGILNRAKDVVDANTPQDQFKRNQQIKAPLRPNMTYQQQQQVAPSNLTRTVNLANSAKNNAITPIATLTKAAVGQVTGNQQARNNALNTYKQGVQGNLNSLKDSTIASSQQIGTGLAYQSKDFQNAQKAQSNLVDIQNQQKLNAIKRAKQGFNTQQDVDRFVKYADNLWQNEAEARQNQINIQKEQQKQLDPKKNAFAIADAVSTALSFGVAGPTKNLSQAAGRTAFENAIKGGATKEVATQVAKKAATNEIIRQSALTGSMGGFQGAINPYITKDPGTVTPTDVITGAVSGGVMGGVLPGTFVAASKGAKPIQNALNDLQQTANQLTQPTAITPDGMRISVPKAPNNTEASFAKRVTPDGNRYVELDRQMLANAPQEKWSKIIKDTITEKFQGKKYPVGGNKNNQALVNSRTKSELAFRQPQMDNTTFMQKGNMTDNLDELISTMHDIRTVRNKKPNQKSTVSHYISGRVPVKVGDTTLYPRVDIEVSKNGSMAVYDIADIKEFPGWDNVVPNRGDQILIDNQETRSGNIVPQNNQNVNPIRGLDRFKLNQKGFAKNPFYKDPQVGKTPKGLQAVEKWKTENNLPNATPYDYLDAVVYPKFHAAQEKMNMLTDPKYHQADGKFTPEAQKIADGISKELDKLDMNPDSYGVGRKSAPSPQVGKTGASKAELGDTSLQSPEPVVQKTPQTQPNLSQAKNNADGLATGTEKSLQQKAGKAANNQTNLESGNTSTSTKQQRGFKSNIAKDTETPLSVYKDIPGYNVKPNKQTIGKAAERVAKDPEGTYDRLLKNGIQQTDDSADALVLLRNLVEKDELDKASKLARATAKAGTDFGQAVQIFSAFRKTTPDGALRDAWNIVNAYNTKNPKKTPIRISAEQSKRIVDLANDLQTTEYGTREWAKKAALLEREKGLLTPNSFLSKVSTVQTMAQLLNPKTAIRNILGNGVLDLAEDLSRLPAVGIDKALKGLGLIDERNMVLPNMKTNWANKLIGFKQGVEDVNLGIRTTGAAGNYDLTKEVFKPGSVGNKLEKLLGYELSSMDKAFYTGRYQSSLENMMKAQKVKVPTPEMKASAEAEALYATFQNNSALSKGLQKGKNALNAGKEWGLGDFILKYPKTPGNIVNVGLDYSPVGFVKGLKSLHDGIKLKNIQTIRNGELLLGRSLVGSGLIAGGAFLAKQGIITGKQDGDFDKASADRDLGKGPFTFNITALGRLLKGEDTKARPGDITANYDWLQPNAIQLSMGANMIINNNSATQQINTNLESLGAGIDTISEQPVFKGVKDFVGDLNSQQGGGIGKAAQGIATNSLSSFVPSLVNQLGQQFDNTKRSTYSDTPVGEAANKVKGRIPGARNTLYPSLNTLGNEQKQYDVGGNNPFNVFFNPAFLNRVKDEPSLQLADDLNKKTGETSQYPRSLTGNQTIDGVKTKLTPEQLFSLKKNVGQTTNNIFQQYAASPIFQNLSDTEKVNALSGALTDINAAGKASLAAKNSLGQFSPGFTGKPTKLSGSQKALLSNEYSVDTKLAGTNIPKGLNQDAVKVIASYDKAKAKEIANNPTVTKALTDWNSGRPVPQITNEVAKQWADYEKGLKDGSITKLEAKDQKIKILRNAFNSQLNDDEKQLYKLSKTKIQSALSEGLITEDNVRRALAIEKQMFDNGLLDSETLAKKLGLGSRSKSSGKSSGTRRSSGRRSTRTAKASKLKFTTTRVKNRQKSFNSSLRKLLASAKV